MFGDRYPPNNPSNEPGTFSLSARPIGPAQFRESMPVHLVFNNREEKAGQWEGGGASAESFQRSNNWTVDTTPMITQEGHASGGSQILQRKNYSRPVLRDMEICLAYSTGLQRKGPDGYEPYPSWRKEPEDEEFFEDEDVYENRTFKEYKPYPSWVNGSGKPVHPPGLSEAQIRNMQSGPFYVCHEGESIFASAPGTTGTFTQPKTQKKMGPRKLRPILIDGHSVALWHGNHAIFSAQGIHVCVEFFRVRGHKNMTVYVPDLKSSTTAVLCSEVLDKLEEDGTLQYLPVTSHINRIGDRIVSNDNRKFILLKTVEQGAVIVSNENYQELYEDARESWRERLNDGILQFDFETPEKVEFKSDRKKQTKTLEELLTF